MADDVRKLGGRIRDVRVLQRRLQSDIAQAAGVGVTTIGRIERGDVVPDLSTLYSISNALGVPLAELLEDTSPKELAPDQTSGATKSDAQMFFDAFTAAVKRREEMIEAAELVYEELTGRKLDGAQYKRVQQIVDDLLKERAAAHA